jgi:hypothetical protein
MAARRSAIETAAAAITRSFAVLNCYLTATQIVITQEKPAKRPDGQKKVPSDIGNTLVIGYSDPVLKIWAHFLFHESKWLHSF